MSWRQQRVAFTAIGNVYLTELKPNARIGVDRNGIPVYGVTKIEYYRMVNMRRISDKFMNDLKNGLLYPIVDRVRKDDTLLLSIRDAAISIYFRGANVLTP